ncbi:MAG: alkaline phosphatase family protein [Chloroflexota bacterium]|nr:alkaline phosphatase family protein [Chloroflexota bacterium]
MTILASRRVLAALLLLVGAVFASAILGSFAHAPQPTTPHVWVIVMENRADTSIVHQRNAPYLNSLITHFGLAENYHALVHGSQPNYVALFSGGLQGVMGNQLVSLAAKNIADQLEAAGKTWRVYAQNLPPGCFVGATATGGPDGAGTYARKHEPAISFRDISSSQARCGNIQDFTAFDPMAGDFELIVPNLENDMHNGTTRAGDEWLRGFIPRIVGSPAWQAGSVLIITWDEGKPAGDNKVATIVIAKAVRPGFKSSIAHTHYSLLHTVEQLLGLPCLGQACHTNTLAEFFGGHIGPGSTPGP